MASIISGAQCRMARGLLKWSVADLADKSGVSSMTIKRMELGDGVPNSQVSKLDAIYQAFVATGLVRFERETVVEALLQQ